MKPVKSERLRKLEAELNDLEQWLQLGLVPKKDVEKHKDEIRTLQQKIEEEKERLQFLKEGGQEEEFIAPKRSSGKGGYNEMPTIPDIDIQESSSGLTDGGYEMESYATDDSNYEEETDEEYYTAQDFEETAQAKAEQPEEEEEEEEDESYFSEKNRWRRGGILDPDANDW